METIIQFCKDYKEIIQLACPLLLMLWVLYRTQRRWLRRSFFERISVSLNYVVDGKFQIRTLQEKACVDIFRNGSVVKKVMAAAKKQKGEEILDLPQDEYFYFLNPVLNTISEQFAAGFVREEAGCGACPQKYLFFLTGGQDDKMRQKKVRALLIRESLLLQTEEMTPEFRNDFQRLRWGTLQKARKEWVETEGKTKRIREIELVV